MQLNCKSLFPSLERFVPMQLDRLLGDIEGIGRMPKLQQRLIHEWESGKGYGFGGWGEDRSRIWKGTYLDRTKRYTHLGVDINAPRGTPVILPVIVRVVNVLRDQDLDLGWGGRVVVKAPTGVYLTMGHLANDSLPEAGSVISAGSAIGHIGTQPLNGNTFEHVHLQATLPEYLDDCTWAELDGYGAEADLLMHPDPFLVEV